MEQQVEQFSGNSAIRARECSEGFAHPRCGTFAHHRNACDHINSNLEEMVDQLQSPLKGRHSPFAGPSLAEKRADDRPDSKRNVVNEEIRRNRVRHRVVQEVGVEVSLFDEHLVSTFLCQACSFGSTKVICRRSSVVERRDFRHLQDRSTPAKRLNDSHCCNLPFVNGETRQHAPQQPSGCAQFLSSIGRLAETVGITVEGHLSQQG